MKLGNWIALDKGLIVDLPKNRPYTRLEAMFSHTHDIDEKKEWTINGYAKLWQWDRKKVRKFINCIGTPKGHLRDRRWTSEGQGVVLKLNNLQIKKDRKGTGKGQVRDSKGDTTIYPNTNTNPNLKDLLEKTWLNFLEMRKSIKKEASLRAQELLIKKLDKLSDGNDELKIEIIEQSIANCYQGLFEVNKKGNNNGHYQQPQQRLPDYYVDRTPK